MVFPTTIVWIGDQSTPLKRRRCCGGVVLSMEMANAVLMVAWSIRVLCGIIACDTSRMMAGFDTAELRDIELLGFSELLGRMAVRLAVMGDGGWCLGSRCNGRPALGCLRLFGCHLLTRLSSASDYL
jgi:hypothetical protein